MSNNETKTVQLKIVSPVAKKFIDTLVQKITEEGWTYNYDKVFTNPFKVFLTKEVYIDSEEPDLTVLTAEYCKKGIIATDSVANVYDTCGKQPPDVMTVQLIDGSEIMAEVISRTDGILETEIEAKLVEDTSESILPVPDEPTSDLVEEVIAEPTTELIEPTEASVEPENKVGDGNVYTLEQLKPIQWHKLTKIGSAYGLHAMKRGDMEAAIVELSQGNKVNEE